MAENKMKEVAKMLGVEMCVPFYIKGREHVYRLNEKGLYNEYGSSCSCTLKNLLVGELEINKPILDNVEKRYLEGVLRPFKDKVEFIKKDQNNYGEWIHFNLKEDWFCLPYFEKDSMYKGMKLNKQYTIEELGLFEDD